MGSVRVLVVYASSRGGTAGLAQMIAESLLAHDVEVEIGSAADIDPVQEYDGIVVGGALYNGRWHEEAAWFVERNLDTLRATLVWFFSSGPLDGSARSGSLAPVSQVQNLARRADIRGHMTFGGYLEAASRRRFARLFSWGKPGDYRDPQHVDEWVERIVAGLATPKRRITIPGLEQTPRGVARVLQRLTDASDYDDWRPDDDPGLDVLTES